MRRIFLCRRTYVATLAITSLAVLGVWRGIDVSMAIASVSVGLAGANAFEESAKHKAGTTYSEEK